MDVVEAWQRAWSEDRFKGNRSMQDYANAVTRHPAEVVVRTYPIWRSDRANSTYSFPDYLDELVPTAAWQATLLPVWQADAVTTYSLPEYLRVVLTGGNSRDLAALLPRWQQAAGTWRGDLPSWLQAGAPQPPQPAPSYPAFANQPVQPHAVQDYPQPPSEPTKPWHKQWWARTAAILLAIAIVCAITGAVLHVQECGLAAPCTDQKGVYAGVVLLGIAFWLAVVAIAIVAGVQLVRLAPHGAAATARAAKRSAATAAEAAEKVGQQRAAFGQKLEARKETVEQRREVRKEERAQNREAREKEREHRRAEAADRRAESADRRAEAELRREQERVRLEAEQAQAQRERAQWEAEHPQQSQREWTQSPQGGPEVIDAEVIYDEPYSQQSSGFGYPPPRNTQAPPPPPPTAPGSMRVKGRKAKKQPRVLFAPGEGELSSAQFRPSYLLPMLKVRIIVTNRRIVCRYPNLLFGFIPMGYTERNMPISGLAGVDVDSRVIKVFLVFTNSGGSALDVPVTMFEKRKLEAFRDIVIHHVYAQR